MTYRIRASQIAYQDDDNRSIVAFTDTTASPPAYVMLQWPHEHGEQDVQLGLDKVYIEVEDQSRSQYGGIHSISAQDTRILFILSDEAKSRLGLEGDIEIVMNDAQPLRPEVTSQLKRMSRLNGILFEDETSFS